jgi:subtilisin family serine protease
LRAAIFLSAFVLTGSFATHAQSGSLQAPAASTTAQLTSTPPEPVRRLLVKLRAPFAQTVEAALPMQSMALSQGAAPSSAVNTFLSRYSARTLRPLYPNLVQMKRQQGLSDAQIAAGIRQRFARRANRMREGFAPPEISRTYILELDPAAGKDPQQILKELNADANVEFAEPQHIYHTTQLPNDPYLASTGTWGQTYQDLWGLYKIDAPSAWNTAQGDGVIVAVVDTGIDYNHPDLAANIWINSGEIPGNGIDDDNNGYVDDVRGWDFTSNTNDPIDHFGHGTHVAGTIAAVGNNGIGVIGVAWHAQVMAVKGLNDFGSGDDTTLAPAIIYAGKNGADVINASWGGLGTSQTIEDAIKYVYSLGVVFVAAAGNSSIDALNFFPANSPEAITVSASDASDSLAIFSDFGPKIDVAAPGVDILSLQAAGTSLGGQIVAPGYCRLSGTSMATPHVAGTAALILSEHPSYSNEDVRQAIRASATDVGPAGWDPSFGYGRVNSAAALVLPDVLEVRINSPAPGATINSPVTISGTATGDNFSHYVLEYGSGAIPSTWTVIQTSNTAVAGGTLGTFDPSVSPDGTYTIRLTAYDQSNHAFVDRIPLMVQYNAIAAPVLPPVPVTALEFKPGVVIQITGTATGATFTGFSLEWAEGINPGAGWSSTNITLAGNGATPVSNGPLGTWDTTGISKADYYTIRLLTANAGNGHPYTNQTTTLVYLEPDLFSQNWPQHLDGAPWDRSGLVPATDAQGNTWLGVSSPRTWVTTGDKFLSFTPDASAVNVTPLAGQSLMNPAAADIDGIAGDEFVVADQNNRVHIVRPDGTLKDLQAYPTSVSFTTSQVALDDVEGNSQLDVVALGSDVNNQAYLFAWRPDGSLLNANFPVLIADNSLDLRLAAQTPRNLVADLRGDGHKEFLVQEAPSPTTFALSLFSQDGTRLGWNAPVFDGFPTATALADLDHNGKLETILALYPGTGLDAILHVLQPDGTERPGWPQRLNYALWQTAVAVGDLDRNGTEEIVVATNYYLYVFEPDGSSFSPSWPQYGEFGKVVLADVNGDGYPEIITTRMRGASTSSGIPTPPGGQDTPARVNLETEITADGRVLVKANRANISSTGTIYLTPALQVIDRDGSVLRSWNLLGSGGNQPFGDATITVGDFNHDGMTDIALTHWNILGGGLSGFLGPGEAMVLSTGAPYRADVNDWPMINHDPRNSAILRRTLSTNTALAAGTNPSVYGQVVTLQAIVSMPGGAAVGVGNVALMEGATTLSIEQVNNGVAAFSTTMLSAGPHTLTARYIGGSYFLPSTSDTWTQVVNRAPLVVTANNKTRLFGTPNPTLDGVITGIQNGDNVYGIYTTTATLASPIGTYVIQSAVAGGGLHTLDNYTFTLYNGTLTVSNLAISIQVATTGHLRFQHIVLAATVAGTGATPTGTVVVKEAGNSIGGGTVDSNGTVSIEVSQLALGKHVITVEYGGDGNYPTATSDSFTFYRSPRPH